MFVILFILYFPCNFFSGGGGQLPPLAPPLRTPMLQDHLPKHIPISTLPFRPLSDVFPINQHDQPESFLDPDPTSIRPLPDLVLPGTIAADYRFNSLVLCSVQLTKDYRSSNIVEVEQVMRNTAKIPAL